SIKRAGRIALPEWHGVLVAQRATNGGIAIARLVDCELRERRGGEQFQAAPRGAARSLKKQYQATGVPAWQRDGPLLFAGDALLFVPGLGIDARQWADVGVPQLRLHWESTAH